MMRLSLTMIVLLVWNCVPAVFAQSPSAPPARVAVAGVIPLINVRVQLEATEGSIAVPYCGETEYGTPLLCGQAVRLEVETPQGWRPPKPRTSLGILADPPAGRIRALIIAPKTKRSLIFAFGRGFVEVSAGQQLRVVVDVWPDEQSMRSGGKASQITSSPFPCPQTDIGW
jgi:hypothetical protein